MKKEILSIYHLNVALKTAYTQDLTPLLHDICLSLHRGKILALAGNSGAGKSMLCHSILGLRYFYPPGYSHSGKIIFEGKDLLCLDVKEMQNIYRRDLAFIPQDPLMIFDPLLKVQQHMQQVLQICLGIDAQQAGRYISQSLEKAGLESDAHIISSYPSMLSRGTLQKLALALALAKKPKLIIADEATGAMDSIAQAQLLFCLKKACQEQNITCILVTHHLGLASQFADRIALMHEGRICEENSIREFLHRPSHPQSRFLLQQICQLYPYGNIDTKIKS